MKCVWKTPRADGTKWWVITGYRLIEIILWITSALPNIQARWRTGIWYFSSGSGMFVAGSQPIHRSHNAHQRKGVQCCSILHIPGPAYAQCYWMVLVTTIVITSGEMLSKDNVFSFNTSLDMLESFWGIVEFFLNTFHMFPFHSYCNDSTVRKVFERTIRAWNNGFNNLGGTASGWRNLWFDFITAGCIFLKTSCVFSWLTDRLLRYNTGLARRTVLLWLIYVQMSFMPGCYSLGWNAFIWRKVRLLRCNTWQVSNITALRLYTNIRLRCFSN